MYDSENNICALKSQSGGLRHIPVMGQESRGWDRWKEKIKSKRPEWALACAGQKSHRRTLYLSLHTTGNHWKFLSREYLVMLG